MQIKFVGHIRRTWSKKSSGMVRKFVRYIRRAWSENSSGMVDFSSPDIFFGHGLKIRRIYSSGPAGPQASGIANRSPKQGPRSPNPEQGPRSPTRGPKQEARQAAQLGPRWSIASCLLPIVQSLLLIAYCLLHVACLGPNRRPNRPRNQGQDGAPTAHCL